MRYVAAYLLANIGGNDSPTASNIEKILGSVGVEAESDKTSKVISELKGKNLEELIAEGQKKLASVPSGGAVAVASTGGGGGGAAPAEASKKEGKEDKKKEEKKEEPESESDEDMGFGLFD